MTIQYSRRLRGIAAPVLAISLLVAGCGGDDDVRSGSSDVGQPSEINPRDPADLREGGNLRLALTSFPATFNPLHVDSDGDVSTVVGWTLPSTVTADEAGVVSTDPDFYSDIRLVNTNPQQIEYTINPKAVWSDGSPITWEDLRSQANALSGRDTGFLVSHTQGYSRIEKVERGADDRQAIVTFGQHYAEWRGLFSPLMPKESTATPQALNDVDRSRPAKSAGPFMVTAIDQGQKRITLQRNPKWWGNAPKLDTVTFSVLDSSARLTALQNNEIDAVDIYGAEEAKSAGSSPGIVVRRAPDATNSHFTFNGAPGSILEDPRLRVAISKAIDRKTITTALQNGVVIDPKPVNNHIYLEGQKGYQDNSAVVSYDPAAAARMLDDLGWRLNGEVREKDGRQLVIRDVMVQQDRQVQMAQIAQQNLAQIGVKLVIETHSGTDLFTKVIDPGNFDIAQFSWGRSLFPLGALEQIYAYNPANNLSNKGRVGSPELNALIDQVLSELDPEKAIEMANQADRMIFELGHSLPVFQGAGNVAVRDNVANYGAFGLSSADYTKVGFVK
ncbi:ABC transporter family substrate-binding protein [Nocardia sp. NPDC048505]|uniref:ABC transporter family substrate-binding protein n=1 Tax=Nocardia sp. NPDC048505 TaxID=3155756 RepID=UPI0033F6BDAC